MFCDFQDKKKVPHQWVSVCYVAPHTCDWCAKSLTNKPAFCCESEQIDNLYGLSLCFVYFTPSYFSCSDCSATVHQTSCKDHVQDCKGKAPKVNIFDNL